MIRLLWIRLFDAGLWEYLGYEAKRQNTTRLKVLKAEVAAEKWLRKNTLSNEELKALANHCADWYPEEENLNNIEDYPF
jgi:hypothetical protein